MSVVFGSDPDGAEVKWKTIGKLEGAKFKQAHISRWADRDFVNIACSGVMMSRSSKVLGYGRNVLHGQ